MAINKVVPNIEGFKTPNFQALREQRYNSERSADKGDLKFTRDRVDNMVDMLNSAAKSINQRISFSIHEETNRVIMKVHDLKTNEVVREIPPKEMIQILEHIHEMIGMFVDESR